MKHRIALLLLPLFLLSLALPAQSPEFGLASFYSDDFHGRKTAYDVTYNKNELTCAHKKYPYGTTLKVTRLDNKKSVTVTVIDKGPYIKGRIVDLSRAAAERLDLIKDVVAKVKVEVVKMGDTKVKESVAGKKDEAKKTTPESYDNTSSSRITTQDAEPARTAESAAVAEKKAASQPQPEKTTEARPASPTPVTGMAAPGRLVGKEFQQYGLYHIQIRMPQSTGYGVQIASLVNYENVFRQVADLQAKSFENVLVSIEEGEMDKPVYKIILGPFETEASAKNYHKDLKSRYKIDGFVVNLMEMVYQKR